MNIEPQTDTPGSKSSNGWAQKSLKRYCAYHIFTRRFQSSRFTHLCVHTHTHTRPTRATHTRSYFANLKQQTKFCVQIYETTHSLSLDGYNQCFQRWHQVSKLSLLQPSSHLVMRSESEGCWFLLFFLSHRNRRLDPGHVLRTALASLRHGFAHVLPVRTKEGNCPLF